MKARTQAANALRALVVTALWGWVSSRATLTPARLAPRRRGWAQGDRDADRGDQARAGHRGRAAVGAHRRAPTLDAELDRLTARAAPALPELCRVGAEVAGALLVTAGDAPARLRCDGAFSMLWGPHRSRLLGQDRAAPPAPGR